jgi:large repetitive protein
LTNIPAGIYSVTVTDANGCSTSASVTITQPALALSASVSGTDVLCFGNATGAADLTVNGGTAPYNYSWSNAATTEDLANLAAGTYTVTITDANGCSTTASVTITQPASGLTSSTTQTNVLCFGNSTGAADLTVSGGTAPYNYSWSNAATTEDLTGLAAGTYTVTITDANGCSTTASVTITQPASGLTAAISGTNVLCFGNATGAADLTVSGGTAPYNYNWSNSATTEDLSWSCSWNVHCNDYGCITDVRLLRR